MTIRGLDGVSQMNFTGALQIGVDLLTKSGVADRLQTELDAKRGKGRPNTLPRYTVMAVLGTLFHLMYSGMPPSLANVLRCLWIEYTPAQLAILGLPADWRDEARLASMHGIPGIQDAEYKRLQAAVVAMLAPIDDTPYKANGNITWAEAEKALADNTEALRPLTERRHLAMNDILAASVPVELLAAFQGHLSTDLHNFVFCPNPRAEPTAKHRKKKSPPMAGYTPKSKRFDGADVVGLTLAIAVGKPGEPELPNIALGMATGPSVAADTNGSLIAIDAADRHPVARKAAGNAQRAVIGDKAYPYARGFTAELNERGRFMLGDFRAEQAHVIDLWAKPQDTDCPRLVNGCIVCPGIPRAVLETADPRLHETYDDMSIDQLRSVDQLYKRIEAGRMPTNGRPKRSIKRKPGRPSKKDDAPAETVFKVEVFCPARRGKIRCPRVPESMTSKAEHLATPPEDTMSYVCTGGPNSKTQLSISEMDFKNYSPLMAGTLEHHSFYKHARAHNEGFHTYIVSPDSGNLRDRSVRVRRSSEISIIIAFAVAISNIRSADAFRAGQRRNDGMNPQQARARWVESLKQALAA